MLQEPQDLTFICQPPEEEWSGNIIIKMSFSLNERVKEE